MNSSILSCDSITAYRERLAPKIGPSRLLSKELPVWKESELSISTKELRDAFLSYIYLPMIPSIDVLREMIAQGVEDWVFGYARGAEGKFQAVKIGTALEKDAIEFAENAFLLKAEEAYRIIGALQCPPGQHYDAILRECVPDTTVPPKVAPEVPRRLMYREVDVSADLDWKKWSEFHDAVIQPLVNAGAELRVKVELVGSSDQGIAPNTVGLMTS